MATATFVRTLDDWNGNAAVYQLDPPLAGYRHVVVSAVDAPFSGAETYIFGCDGDGEVADFDELPGSTRGVLSHPTAAGRSGYELD